MSRARMGLLSGPAGLAAVVVALPVHGQTATEADLDQVTVTATRSETAVIDAPATVSVITSEAIETQLAQDVKDLVRFEPGVAVRSPPSRFTAAGSSLGRDGNSSFNIRGLEGNRVLIQVDGVRMPDAYSFGAQAVGRGDYLDLDILKSVEIVRGPSSALYGSDGLAGSISFRTKDPSDLLKDGRSWAAGGRAAYASSDETFTKNLLAAGKAGAWEGLIAYTRRDGEGQETRGDNNVSNINRTTPNPEDNFSNAVLAKAVYTLNDANHFRFTVDHHDSETEWNVLSAISASTLGLFARDEMDRNRFTVDHQFDNAGGVIDSVRTVLYYQDSDVRQFSSEDRSTAADRIRDTTFDNELHGAILELSSEIDHGSFSQRFVYGADYSRTRQASLRDGTVPPAGETFPTHAFPTTNYTLAGVFIQDEITFAGGRISLYPALRWDYFEIDPQDDALFVGAAPANQNDSHLTPKLGLLARLTDRLNLFANAAAGFKAPAPSQVNNGFTNPVNFYRSISNPNLDPETSETFEVGLRLHEGRWSGSLAAFTGQYDDFIDQRQISGNFTPANPGVYQYINLPGVEIYGAEAKAQFEIGSGFELNAAASYAHGDSEATTGTTPLSSIEPFKFVSGLDWRAPSSRFGGQLFTTYSAGKGPSRAGITCTPSCFLPDSFLIFDAVGWWKITDGTTLRAGVFNIADEKYFWWSDARGVTSDSTFIDGFSQPSRNVSVSLAMRF